MLSGISNIFEQLKPHFDQIQDGFKIMVSKTPESLIELSKQGWYIDFEITPRIPIELSGYLKKGEVDYVDNYLSKYYGDKLNRIKEKLYENYPNRQKILKEAFDCFRRKEYYSTISLLLTQADGFCFDKTKKLYFKNNRELQKEKIYVPEVEKEIKRISGGIVDILLEPMKNATLINEDTRNLTKFSIKLNRHAILHGMDTDYGTKLNSLKIISFVNYLDDMLEDIKN